MAELTISPDVIRDALKDFVAAYEPTGAAATEVGTVVDAADGIAHLEGLPGVMANELVTFADGTSGPRAEPGRARGRCRRPRRVLGHRGGPGSDPHR